jgi:hypothetical protein
MKVKTLNAVLLVFGSEYIPSVDENGKDYINIIIFV